MTFEEGNLSFDFDDENWSHLCRYDEERDYKKINIPETKAVDFIGIFKGHTLVLFEIKDFRKHPIENKHRTERNASDPIEVEMAKKVRDTLAGIVGGARNSTHKNEMWRNYLTLLQNGERGIHAVLWLEETTKTLPPEIAQKRKQAKGGTYTDMLKKKLSWLTPHVTVVDHKCNPYGESLSFKFL